MGRNPRLTAKIANFSICSNLFAISFAPSFYLAGLATGLAGYGPEGLAHLRAG